MHAFILVPVHTIQQVSLADRADLPTEHGLTRELVMDLA